MLYSKIILIMAIKKKQKNEMVLYLQAKTMQMILNGSQMEKEKLILKASIISRT